MTQDRILGHLAQRFAVSEENLAIESLTWLLRRSAGRWSPSEMPSVGNCLAISSAVRGPGWRCSCGTRRSGTQIAHTPAHARERVERYRNPSAKADSLCC